MTFGIYAAPDGLSGEVQVNGVTVARITANGIDKVQDGSITASKLATAVKPIGVDQTWQNMVGTRALDATFTNTTGRTIGIWPVAVVGSGTQPLVVVITSPGQPAATLRGSSATVTNYASLFAPVPDKATYVVSGGGMSGLLAWNELR